MPVAAKNAIQEPWSGSQAFSGVTLKMPMMTRISPTKPDVPGSPTEASMNSMKTVA